MTGNKNSRSAFGNTWESAVQSCFDADSMLFFLSSFLVREYLALLLAVELLKTKNSLLCSIRYREKGDASVGQ